MQRVNILNKTIKLENNITIIITEPIDVIILLTTDITLQIIIMTLTFFFKGSRLGFNVFLRSVFL